MDEPLLNGSPSPRSCRITRKSEHPFLNLFSPRGSHKQAGAEFGSRPASRLCTSQPPSPKRPTSPFRSISAGTNDKYRRSASFGCSSPTPESGVNEADYESFGGEAVSLPGNQSVLPQIPEKTKAAKQIRFSNLPPEWDLEAPYDLDNDDWEANDRKASGEDRSGDDEGKVEEERRWIPRVSGFIISSIPEVLHSLSSAPEHDYFGCTTCQPHLHDEDERLDADDLLPNSNDADDEFTPSPGLLRAVSSVPDFRGSDCAEQERSLSRGSRNDQASKSGYSTKRSIHRAKTAPMLSGLTKCKLKRASESKSKESSSSSSSAMSSIVVQAFVGLCVYLTIGVTIFSWKKDEFSGTDTVTVVDALYFCIVTMCTIGYGDIAPVTPSAKLLSCLLIFVGFGFIEALLSGMLTFVLDRQEHLLLTVVEDGHHERAKNYFMNAKKGRMRIRMKVALAVLTVVMTIIIGVFFLRFFEGTNWVDSLYVTCISITTVGYGDVSFQTVWGRLFAAVWLLLSTLGVARAFLFLAEARVHSRHRHLAKKILEKRISTDDLPEMDLDNDGHISKSEFVVYKLKKMGKIGQRDVVEICNQFDVLDNIDAGKITLGQLLDDEE